MRAAIPARLSIGIAIAALSAATALASANVSCRIDDAILAFELEAIAGRAGPIVQVQTGTIRIKPSAMKLASPQVAFGREQIVQQWSRGDELRLHIEAGDEAARENVVLVILARRDKAKDNYRGRYVLQVSSGGGTREFKGRIKECVAG